MPFEHAIQSQHQPAPHNPYENLHRKLARTEAAIADIDRNMAAPHFYHGDTEVVLESRALFEDERAEIYQKLSSTALIAAEVSL